MHMEIKDLSKKYGDVTALDHIRLSLKKGICGLLGSNGAGKSTLMKIITGNITEYEGEVLYDGEDIRKLGRKYRKKLGYMPQQQAVYDDFSLVQYLYYIGSLKMIEKHELKKQIEDIAEKVNLSDVKNNRIGTYSGGMKQRALLAQALLGSPEILILDEPSAGLDPEERVNMRDLIAEAASDKMILVSTHIVSDVELISDHVIFLKKGHIVYSGKTDDAVSKFTFGQTGENAPEDTAGKENEKDVQAETSGKYNEVEIIGRYNEKGISAGTAGKPLKSRSAFTRTPLEKAYLYYMQDAGDEGI